jgi:competence protein ComGC
MSKLSTLKEFLGFLHREKKWWLIPMVIILAILAVLIIFAQSSAIAPFLYPFF